MQDVTAIANKTVGQLEVLLQKYNISDVGLSYSSVQNISQSKGFLHDSGSVARFLAIVFFVLLVCLATVMDLLHCEKHAEKDEKPDICSRETDVENLKLNFETRNSLEKLRNEIFSSDSRGDEEESLPGTIEPEVEVEVDIHEISADIDETSNAGNEEKEVQKDLQDEEELLVVKDEIVQDEKISNSEVENKIIRQSVGNSKGNDIPEKQFQPKKYKKDEESEERKEGMLKVLTDAGFANIAGNTMAEMGVDFMDGKKMKNGHRRTKSQAVITQSEREDYTDAPTLTGFRKLTRHSRDFNEILGKFKRQENGTDENTEESDETNPITSDLIDDEEQKRFQSHNNQDESNNAENVDAQTESQKKENEDIEPEAEKTKAKDSAADEIEQNDTESEIEKEYMADIDNQTEVKVDITQQNSAVEIISVEVEAEADLDLDTNLEVFTEFDHGLSSARCSGWGDSRLGGIESIIANQDSLEKTIEEEKKIENVIEENLKIKSAKKEISLVTVIRAFSIIRNLKKIFCVADSSEELSCLHGIRFLSMTWIILGHTFYFAIPFLDNPLWALDKVENSWSMEAVEQGTFAVDSFFFLSGFLVSFMFLKRRIKATPMFWFKMTLHRFLR